MMEDEDDLFRCAICGTAEGDSSNLTTQSSLQTNATVGCGHQLYVFFYDFSIPCSFTHSHSLIVIIVFYKVAHHVSRENCRDERNFHVPFVTHPSSA